MDNPSDPTAAFYPYLTPHGPLTIRTDAAGITDVALGEVAFPGARKPTELANRAATEILEYLAGKRREFDLPLAPRGSRYQLTVWEATCQIPYGSSLSCRQLAERLGDAEGFRAVGLALGKNPLAILVPAHRVTGANGAPLGKGRSAQLKGALLRMEQERCAS